MITYLMPKFTVLMILSVCNMQFKHNFVACYIFFKSEGRQHKPIFDLCRYRYKILIETDWK